LKEELEKLALKDLCHRGKERKRGKIPEMTADRQPSTPRKHPDIGREISLSVKSINRRYW
jgi:hypothetical protein